MESDHKGGKMPNYRHAWRGSWNRPMKIDEDALHPFTVARMTNHNVRGTDSGSDERSILKYRGSPEFKKEDHRAA